MPDQLHGQVVQIMVQQAQQTKQCHQGRDAFEGLEQGHGLDSSAKRSLRVHSGIKKAESTTI